MLLLPGAQIDDAYTFAERVRNRIEGHTFTFPGGTLTRTASFGVASWPHEKIREADDLVRSSDDALYVAKETGRNRVVRFDGEEFNAHQAANDGNAEPRPDFGEPEPGGAPAAG
jgi:diguanylate cyclase (GGDEF)-like protein